MMLFMVATPTGVENVCNAIEVPLDAAPRPCPPASLRSPPAAKVTRLVFAQSLRPPVGWSHVVSRASVVLSSFRGRNDLLQRFRRDWFGQMPVEPGFECALLILRLTVAAYRDDCARAELR